MDLTLTLEGAGWLLLSILTLGALIIMLRQAGQWKLDLFVVITTNYLGAAALAYFLSPGEVRAALAGPDPWLWLALLQGLQFIINFWLIGTATMVWGVGLVAMVTKLSVLIPTLLSWLLWNDAMNGLRWGGLVLALVAMALIYLPYLRGDQRARIRGFWQWAPLIIFGLTGWVDFIFYHYQQLYTPSPHVPFIVVVVGTAGVLGLGVLAVRRRATWQATGGPTRWKSVLFGLTLSLINVASLVVWMRALEVVPATIFYPVNNLGQLVWLTFAGVLMYRERLHPSSWVGLAVAAAAILLLSA